VVNTCLLASGVFLLWSGVFYSLASEKGKVVFEYAFWGLCGVALVDYLFFGKHRGILSSNLLYLEGLEVTNKPLAVNLLAVLATLLLLTLICRRWPALPLRVLGATLAAVLCMSAVNAATISRSVSAIDADVMSRRETVPNFTLSKTEKNVVVIMMDRGMGLYLPYIFNEKPELAEQFDGFTYYANTVSFGGFTNIATPAFFGGYEYTPVEMNRREDEALADKHNEALKVMPVLFSNDGYDVTVLDPPYAGYQWVADLSIYDEYENIHAYAADGYFSDSATGEAAIESRMRNFFCYSLMKVAPLFAQSAIYADGSYISYTTAYTSQIIGDAHRAQGVNNEFMDSYYELENLSAMTTVTDNGQGSFLMMTNELTHNNALLQEPDYLPLYQVDNSEYDAAHTERFTVNGKMLEIETEIQHMSYDINMCALLQLGKWLDYLKEQGVYDNTRIIIASDHGRSNLVTDDFVLDNSVYDVIREDERANGDMSFFYPLLLVKDFNAEGFSTSYAFMTNADVPTLATEGVVDNPVNPMTGKALNSDEKTAHDQYVFASPIFDIEVNNGNTFLPGDWYSVHDDIWQKSNWKKIASDSVFKGE